MARMALSRHATRQACPPQVVVAVPVRDERERILFCLAALADQRDARQRLLPRDAYGVVLFLNGCRDDTWRRVEAHLETLPLALWMYEAELPSTLNHAGGARAVAMHLARAVADRSAASVLFTTDADSRVPSDWIGRTLGVMDQGCHAVAGTVELHTEDEAERSADFMARQGLEAIYADLLDEIDARFDPLEHNPWPTHRVCSGANMAVRIDALDALGAIPVPHCGEDRALIAALKRHDFKVRHEPTIPVRTSARFHGRAAGGMADTMLFRSTHPQVACDEMLEGAAAVRFRANVRAHVRWLHRQGRIGEGRSWHDGLDALLRPSGHVPACLHFGELWHWLESHCAGLERKALHADQLHVEIRRARRLLATACPGVRGTTELAVGEVGA
jgi:hypothetical protein